MPEYTRNPPLDEAQLASDPLVQLERWLDDARGADLIEPTAMTLATVSARGQPSARMVLFKGIYKSELSFATNYESRKGLDLAAHPRAALVFWWDKLERQVRIEGTVKKLPRAESDRLFHARPRLSQISAHASDQSRPIASRAELERRLARSDKQFAGEEVPLPDFWGGYSLKPEYFEFWQGRRGRLHDRLVYRRKNKIWRVTRLQP